MTSIAHTLTGLTLCFQPMTLILKAMESLELTYVAEMAS